MTVSTGRRALIGPLMIVVGVAHVAITPVLYPDAVRSILAGGVFDSVGADPGLSQLRGLGFWFATTGLGLIFTGWAVKALERGRTPVPAALPLFLAGIGVWGVVLMPRSPFWVFLALAVVAVVRRATDRRSASPIAEPAQPSS